MESEGFVQNLHDAPFPGLILNHLVVIVLSFSRLDAQILLSYILMNPSDLDGLSSKEKETKKLERTCLIS